MAKEDLETMSREGKIENYHELFEEECWRFVLSDERGRALMLGIMTACNFGRSAVSGSEAMNTFYYGKQSVGNAIFSNIVEHDRTAYARMMTEAEGREEAFNIRASGLEGVASGSESDYDVTN